MSDQPIAARVDMLEQQMVRIADIQERNAKAIEALIYTVDSRFTAVETRLTNVEKQLVALNESNQLLAELICSRLPPTNEGNL